jgi:hypothetical protein
LQEVARRSEYIGEKIELDLNELVPLTWSLNEKELMSLIDYHRAENRLHVGSGINNRGVARVVQLRMEYDGWRHLEDYKMAVSSSEQCFVAMNIHPSLDDAFFNGIIPAIEAAGYRPLRIDQKEHANLIDDEIFGEIRTSRFLVADLTNQRQSVYFETGFAEGLGLPVIWTCQEDDFDNRHFDIEHRGCIDWREPSDLRDRLKKRILALLGPGPHHKNP